MAKNGIQQWQAGLAERARAWTGGAVIMGSIPLDLLIFFLPLSKNFQVFWRAILPVLEALYFQYRCWYGRHSLKDIIMAQPVHPTHSILLIIVLA